MIDSYQAWEKIRDVNAGEWALTDVATGRAWTYAEIQAEVNDLPSGGESVRFPRFFGRFDLRNASCVERRRHPVSGRASVDIDRAIRGNSGEDYPRKTDFRQHRRAAIGPFQFGAVAADPRKIVSTMGLRRDLPNLGVISMAHSYGFSNLVLPLLLHGIPLVWLGDPAAWLG